ncbi:ABC transporter permease [Skermanella stibiiresistens SB22]|uniref:ABC transporter permease n=1 Tax=Skermanella stibiiresistens SB22 TaxID=1385369 RepID=W9H495_9PROT|nr:ABC transporter permease [Skermanella stibiiresistens]EWY38578.1 ABC transporter permease [Skermanella stibiiresistens SB22]
MESTNAYLSPWRRVWLYALLVIVLFFLVAPVLVVVPMSFSASNYLEFPPSEWSFRWYETFFGSVEWLHATRTSLTVAGLTTLLATPLGVAAAAALSRSRVTTAQILKGVFLLPQVVPVIILGIGVFFLYIRLGLVNSLPGIVLAHTALALPFVVVTTLSGLKSFDHNLEIAAQSLGAHPIRAFLGITLPRIKLSVLAGALFAFITSLDEVVISLFIAGGDNTLLTRKMFMSLRDQLDPTIAAVSSILIVMSIVGVVIFMVAAGTGKGERRS